MYEGISVDTACLYFYFLNIFFMKYSRLSLSRNRRDPLKNFEISVLRHIRCVVLRKNNLNNQNLQMTM